MSFIATVETCEGKWTTGGRMTVAGWLGLQCGFQLRHIVCVCEGASGLYTGQCILLGTFGGEFSINK